MSRRIKLHYILVDILDSNYVYFQPPESIKMNYPCIIYSRSRIDAKYANNKLYLGRDRYQIITVDKNPDNTLSEEILKLPLSSFDRQYTKDNLNHDVCTLYF